MIERLKNLFEKAKKLLRRLRGERRSPQEILRAYNRQIKSESQPKPEQRIAPIKIESSPAEFVLDIRNADDMKNYLAKANDFSGFENFVRNPALDWVKTRLDKVGKILSELSERDDFDNEEFNFKLAKKIRALAEHMLDIYKDAKSSTRLDENSRQQLCATVDDYLSGIGLTKKVFNVGDRFDDWADLAMENSHAVITTPNRNLNSTIAAIEIQPHIIFYRDESGAVEQLLFGGSCQVYKFKEG